MISNRFTYIIDRFLFVDLINGLLCFAHVKLITELPINLHTKLVMNLTIKLVNKLRIKRIPNMTPNIIIKMSVYVFHNDLFY